MMNQAEEAKLLEQIEEWNDADEPWQRFLC